MLISHSQCYFEPSRAHGPCVGSAKANGLPEAHGPWGHCSPLHPLSVALPAPATTIGIRKAGFE